MEKSQYVTPSLRLETTLDACQVAYLRNQDEIRTAQVKIANSLAHIHLALPRRINLCSIKSVDTVLESELHDLSGLVGSDASTVGEPSSEREKRDAKARRAKTAEDHVFRIILGAVLGVGSCGSHFDHVFGEVRGVNAASKEEKKR